MGVEYRHFVIPATCEVIPSPARVCNLVTRLAEERWIPRAAPEFDQPAGATRLCWPMEEEDWVTLMATDFRLSWSMEWPSPEELRYAFTCQSDPYAFYALQVHYSSRFLSPLSELVDPLQDPVGHEEPRSEGLLSKVKGLFAPRGTELLDLAVRCECGAALEDRLDLFDGYEAFFARCPNCGKAFRPQERRAKLRNGWTAGVNRRPGGLLHHFAVVIDCGKSLPDENAPGVLEEKLHELISDSVGSSLFEFGDLY